MLFINAVCVTSALLRAIPVAAAWYFCFGGSRLLGPVVELVEPRCLLPRPEFAVHVVGYFYQALGWAGEARTAAECCVGIVVSKAGPTWVADGWYCEPPRNAKKAAAPSSFLLGICCGCRSA